MKRTTALIFTVLFFSSFLFACGGKPTPAIAPFVVLGENPKQQRDRDVVLTFSYFDKEPLTEGLQYGIQVAASEYDVTDPDWTTPHFEIDGKKICRLDFIYRNQAVPLSALNLLDEVNDYTLQIKVNGEKYMVDNIRVENRDQNDPYKIILIMEITKDPR